MSTIANLILSVIQTLNPVLAAFLTNFKTKNPVVWAVIVLLLLVAFVGIHFLQANGIITADTAFHLQLIDSVILAFTGSHTTEILSDVSEKENK